MEESKPDSLGSVRYVCDCGTHFNSNPEYPDATTKWLEKHRMCKVEESKLYTAFTYMNIARIPDVEEDHEIVCHPHNPRRSVDGMLGIATGIWEDIPAVVHLSQTEAELLMQTPEWTTPDETGN